MQCSRKLWSNAVHTPSTFGDGRLNSACLRILLSSNPSMVCRLAGARRLTERHRSIGSLELHAQYSPGNPCEGSVVGRPPLGNDLSDLAGLTGLGSASEIGVNCSMLKGAIVRLGSSWLVMSTGIWELPRVIMPACL